MGKLGWNSRQENQVRKLVDDMMISMTRGDYSDKPDVSQIRPFVIYTPKWRFFWLPDDDEADDSGASLVSWRSPEGKPVHLAMESGLYAVPHGEEDIHTSGPQLRLAGKPADYAELSALIFDILTDRSELTPFECRRSCATAQPLEEIYYNPSGGEMGDGGGRVVRA